MGTKRFHTNPEYFIGIGTDSKENTDCVRRCALKVADMADIGTRGVEQSSVSRCLRQQVHHQYEQEVEATYLNGLSSVTVVYV